MEVSQFLIKKQLEGIVAGDLLHMYSVRTP